MRASKTGNDFFQESYPSLPFESSPPGSNVRMDAPQAVNQSTCIRRIEAQT